MLPPAPAREPWSWADIAKCYYVSPADPAARDFFFVWISRTLYYTGGSVQAFLVYFVRDRLDDDGPTRIDRFLAPRRRRAELGETTSVFDVYIGGVGLRASPSESSIRGNPAAVPRPAPNDHDAIQRWRRPS